MFITLHFTSFDNKIMAFDLLLLTDIEKYDFVDGDGDDIKVKIESIEDQFAIRKIIAFVKSHMEDK